MYETHIVKGILATHIGLHTISIEQRPHDVRRNSSDGEGGKSTPIVVKKKHTRKIIIKIIPILLLLMIKAVYV